VTPRVRVVIDPVAAARVSARVREFPRLREAVESISTSAGIPEELVRKHLDQSVLRVLERLGERYATEMAAVVEGIGKLRAEVDGYYRNAFGRKLNSEELAALRSALERLRDTSLQLVPPDVWAQRRLGSRPAEPAGTPPAGQAPSVQVRRAAKAGSGDSPDARSRAPRPGEQVTPLAGPSSSETPLRAMLDRIDEDLDVLAGHPGAPAMADEASAVRRLVEAGDLRGASARLSQLRRRVDIGLSSAGEGALERPFGGDEEARTSTRTPTAPSGAGPAVQLDVNAPPSADPTGSRLLAHVRDALERFEHEGFTDAQRAALRDNPQLRQAFRGARIDEFAKEAVDLDPELQHVIVTGLYEPGADFYDSATGRWYDITTVAAWKDHVTKYGAHGSRLPTERQWTGPRSPVSPGGETP